MKGAMTPVIPWNPSPMGRDGGGEGLVWPLEGDQATDSGLLCYRLSHCPPPPGIRLPPPFPRSQAPSRQALASRSTGPCGDPAVGQGDFPKVTQKGVVADHPHLAQGAAGQPRVPPLSASSFSCLGTGGGGHGAARRPQSVSTGASAPGRPRRDQESHGASPIPRYRTLPALLGDLPGETRQAWA